MLRRAVAQLVARLVWDQEVASSSLAGPTMRVSYNGYYFWFPTKKRGFDSPYPLHKSSQGSLGVFVFMVGTSEKWSLFGLCTSK